MIEGKSVTLGIVPAEVTLTRTLHGSLVLAVKKKTVFQWLNASVQWAVAGLRVTFLHVVIENPGLFPLVVPPSLRPEIASLPAEKGDARGASWGNLPRACPAVAHATPHILRSGATSRGQAIMQEAG